MGGVREERPEPGAKMMTAFCIDAMACPEFATREPRVFYRVWYGRKPPSVFRQILAMGGVRPAYQSVEHADCERWIAAYHAAEARAAAFNGAALQGGAP